MGTPSMMPDFRENGKMRCGCRGYVKQINRRREGKIRRNEVAKGYRVRLTLRSLIDWCKRMGRKEMKRAKRKGRCITMHLPIGAPLTW